ncbi:MAG: hypothetical protein B6244_05305 [Candidatus Cloacimonetes bacterium 4572_55]|nr:MAG: hypothetical protein B6244_05305 [Candidatus Cloacimonetes bacterium 4572_55]
MGTRGRWGTKFGFVLAAAGSAIGLGNLWKFPYIAYDNQGGPFVLIYLVCIALVGIPIMIAEVLVGRRANRNPVGAFHALSPGQPLWRIVGWLGVASGFVILSYYSVVAGWTLEYSIRSITGYFVDMEATAITQSFVEFLGNPIRQVGWHFVFITLTVIVVVGGVSKGIERWTKILVPLLFSILIVLMIYSMRVGEGGKALAFLFNLDFSTITAHSVLEALGHAFFTLSLGMGAMLTYGSYLSKDSDIGKAVLTISILDTLVALVACLIMYPIIFANPELDISESIGIIFTTLPYIFQNMPFGQIVSPLFFCLMAFAALTSTISLLEVVVSYAIDELKWDRSTATILTGSIIFFFGVPSALSNGAVGWLSGLTLLSKGGQKLNWFDSFDYLASNWMLPIGGMMIALFAGWAMSYKDKKEEFETGKVGFAWLNVNLWDVLIKFVAPVAVFLVLLYKLGIING